MFIVSVLHPIAFPAHRVILARIFHRNKPPCAIFPLWRLSSLRSESQIAYLESHILKLKFTTPRLMRLCRDGILRRPSNRSG